MGKMATGRLLYKLIQLYEYYCVSYVALQDCRRLWAAKNNIWEPESDRKLDDHSQTLYIVLDAIAYTVCPEEYVDENGMERLEKDKQEEKNCLGLDIGKEELKKISVG